ncbi:MAG: 1-deoxy-D-xylulose-5-phosphate synthase [Spirochaetota bacterium]
MSTLLSGINSPKDLKNLPVKDLPDLAREIRDLIIQVISKNGGHLSSNLGVVELTIALHKVFDSPVDKIIWDVGHQCYAHKILTGRKDKFYTIRRKGGLSGFPKKTESEHDIIETGHASTSLSAGLGLLIGQQLKNQPGKVIAVIGDGALSGGMAFEALNLTGHMHKNLIIILNDNNMSISPNVGALSSYLSRLTATRFYQDIRNKIDNTVRRIPWLGMFVFDLLVRLKKGIKAIFFSENIFSDLGYEYVGPIDGHNIPKLVKIFRVVKTLDKPVVVHVKTRKGKGYHFAEGDPTLYHGVSPFSMVDGKLEKKSSLTFTEVFAGEITDLAEKDRSIVAITAAMVKGAGLSLFQEKFPERLFDVGIAEQHAVTFAAGLARAGLRPIVAIYSTFIQRAVDQVIHDVALPHLPVIFALDRAGLVGEDGETHQGVFDIPLFRGIPGITILSPGDAWEMRRMLEYAFSLESPVIIRYPKAPCREKLAVESEPIASGKGVFIGGSGGDVLFIATGGILEDVIEAADSLCKRGIQSDVYNVRFIKPVDEDYLAEIIKPYRLVVSVEDGSLGGGLGEYLASFIQREKIESDFRFLGVPDRFIPHARRNELIGLCGLDRVTLAEYVRKALTSAEKLTILKRDYNSTGRFGDGTIF